MDDRDDAEQGSEKVTDPAQTDALAVAGVALADALGRVFRVAARRGRAELTRAAVQGRVRFELRQLRRDRQRMFEKLGREVVNLVEGGEVTHPGLVRGAQRIEQLDAQISDVETRIRQEAEAAAASEGEKNLDGQEGPQ